MSTISHYVGDGGTTQFDITFSYSDSETVKAKIDGVESAFTFVNPSRVEFETAPRSGAEVRIYRETDVSLPVVDFEDGAIIRAPDLDAAISQPRQRVEELGSEILDISDRALKFPVGEPGVSLPIAGARANKFIAFLADGSPVMSEGTGTDAGLRSDIAADDGAKLIGLPSGSVLDAIKYVTPEMFGARADLEDNSAELSSAASFAAAAGVELRLSTIYECTAAVAVPANTTVRGMGKGVSGIVSSYSPAVNVLGSGVAFHDMQIATTGAVRVAIAVTNNDAPSVTNCKIDGRLYFTNLLALEEKQGPVIFGSDFHCDFGADYDGSIQLDVISTFGFFGTKIIGNDFNVANVNRILNISDAVITNPSVEVSDFNSRGVVIDANTFRGKGGKQAITPYTGSAGVKITNNHFELSDDLTVSGNRWTSAIENKTAANARDAYDIGGAMVIEGNTGFVGRAPFILMQGSYGITQVGFDGDRRNTVKIMNNHVRRMVDNSDPFISVRFMNEVVSDGNTWEIPGGIANRIVAEYASNESLSVGKGDTYSGGLIMLTSQVSDLSGLTFSGAIGVADVGACMVRDFDGRGAVRVAGVLSAQLIRVDGLKSRPRAGTPTTECLAVHCTSNTSIAALEVVGCNAVHPTGGSLAVVVDANTAAGIVTIKDNNWQPRLRGFGTAPPTTGTYIKGDTWGNNSPAFGGPTQWTCYVAGSPGTWGATASLVRKNTTANRPVLTANDVGVRYLDTTLAAAGKPIDWTGSAWVDQSGATV